MKPLRLEFQAFGSYPNREVVDFTVLAKRGLFVVTGPTGTGKTTIFDAMVYALFGTLPGSRSGAEGECRSQHAPLGVETYVQLDFEVDGVVYRVWRKPTQLRPAKKGGGTATDNADASLTKFLPSGGTEPVASKVTPVTDRCKDLVGLDAVQFQRVVLLPQGAFTAFLLAKEQEREELLRPLFGGHVYGKATQWLKDEMQRLDKLVEKSDNEVNHHLVNAATSLVAVLLGWLGEEAAVADVVASGDAAMQTRIDDLQAEQTARRAALDQLQKDVDVAGDAAARAEAAASLFDRADAAARRLAELTATKDAIERDRARCGDSRRARPVVKAKGAVDASQEAVRSAQAALDAFVAAVRDGFAQIGRPAPEPAAGAVSAAVTAAVQELRADQGLLEAVGNAQVALNEAEAAVDAAEREVEAARVALVSAQSEQSAQQGTVDLLSPVAAALPTRQAEAERVAKVFADAQALAAARDDAQKAERAVLAAKEAVVAAGRAVDSEQARVDALMPVAADVPMRRVALDAAESAVDQRKRLAVAQGVLVDARAAAEVADRAYVEVMKQFIATQAPRLAEGLAEGEPCPVCGSAEHPNPARLDSDEAVDHEQVDAARAEVGTAAGAVAAAETAVANLEETLGAAASLDPAELSAQRDAAAALLQQAVDAERELDEARSALVAATEALTKAKQTEADFVTGNAVADQKVAGLLAVLDDAASIDVVELAAQRDAAAALLQQAVDAERELGEARSALVAATEALTKAKQVEADAVTAGAVARQGAKNCRELLEAAQAAAAHINPKALALRVAVAEGLELQVRNADAMFSGVTAATAALGTASASLDDALSTSGFGTVDAAIAVCLDVQQEHRLEAAVAAWDQEFGDVRAALAAYQQQGVPESRPDAASLRAVADEASSAAKDAAEAFTTASNALRSAGESLVAARRVGADSATERAQRDVARKVFRTCNGEAGFKVKLERWVLSQELGRVTAAANEHLARMSNGRYRLQRDETRGGLVLQVHDVHTGKSRATNSLSGGEQFQASLSLALGLADVVSHGGVASGKQFEALFVDEGFGSLDQDALTQAIDALEKLHASGRMVGAITHVEEMKQRLHRGIEVFRLPNDGGSTLRVNP